jgi:hypothetical protein
MKKICMLVFVNFFIATLWAQPKVPDSIGVVTVNKDPRIDILGKKMAEYNESLASKLHSTKGYRLMLLSTDDRAKALQVRTQLLQYFPEQEVYMVFQSPFIKIKFGNFLDKNEAEDYRKQIISTQIVTGNIYVVPEMVEVKAEKINQALEGN